MRTMQERALSASSSTPQPSRWGRAKTFFHESWVELKRVIWPSREEVMKMTGLVVAVVIFVGLFMYVWDRVLAQLTGRLFGR